MPEYEYKQFKIRYDIKLLKDQNFYQAEGRIACNLDNNLQELPQTFQTESHSKSNVTKEIKKIMKQYIDFEWKQFFLNHE